jgi:hypothetical protein
MSKRSISTTTSTKYELLLAIRMPYHMEPSVPKDPTKWDGLWRIDEVSDHSMLNLIYLEQCNRAGIIGVFLLSFLGCDWHRS